MRSHAIDKRDIAAITIWRTYWDAAEPSILRSLQQFWQLGDVDGDPSRLISRK